jgi:UDP-N-acetylmuramate--alanine ligase
LAAISVAHEVGVSDAAIQRALRAFSGIGRRFQKQTVQIQQGEILLVDDYGHHPRELAAVFQAIRDGWQQRRLIVVFQPHRYSRTRDLFDEFVEVLSQVDMLFLLDIYAAGEAKIAGVSSESLGQAIHAKSGNAPIFVPQQDKLASLLLNILQDQDIVLTLGAGNIGALAATLPRLLHSD